MAQFYGTVCGSAGEGARQGGKESGLTTQAAGYAGCIQVRVWYDEDKKCDRFRVSMIPWKNSETSKWITLAEGILDADITDPFLVPALFA